MPSGSPGATSTWTGSPRSRTTRCASGVVLLVEDDEGPVGHAIVAAPDRGRAHVTDVYVRPRGRRHGVAKALLSEAAVELAERGVRYVSLDVLTSNADARAVWERLG